MDIFAPRITLVRFAAAKTPIRHGTSGHLPRVVTPPYFQRFRPGVALASLGSEVSHFGGKVPLGVAGVILPGVSAGQVGS